MLSLSQKKRILNEDAGTGEVPKGKIEEKKKYGANISILGKRKKNSGPVFLLENRKRKFDSKNQKICDFLQFREKRETHHIPISTSISLYPKKTKITPRM